MGIANAFSQGGIFGFAGIFPNKYTGAIMLGSGFSGLSMNVSRMCTLAAFPVSELEDDGQHDNTAFIGCLIYFGIASLIVLLWIACYFLACKTEYAEYYLNQAGTDINRRSSTLNILAKSTGSLGYWDNVSLFIQADDDYDEISSINDPQSNGREKTYLEVYKDIFLIAFQVLLCFIITFVVFPGTQLSTTFDFLGDSALDVAWFSVLMITIFNIFDTIGRFLASWVRIFTPKTLLILTLFRLVFIPTSILIQLEHSPSWLFQSDWFRITNMALFALTNGYNSTLCMIYGPSLANNLNKEKAGIIMSFNLVGGIFFGSLIASFGMNRIG